MIASAVWKTFSYDNSGRRTMQPFSKGTRTSQAYDDQGNRLRVQSPLGRINTFVYDSVNKQVACSEGVCRGTAYDKDSEISLVAEPVARSVTVIDETEREQFFDLKLQPPIIDFLLTICDK